jgi:hypothetical protein
MKKNSGRSGILHPHPVREYLLKGLIRCAYCGMPMWAQTYKNSLRYYREHHESRGITFCPAKGGYNNCSTADDQVGKLVDAGRSPTPPKALVDGLLDLLGFKQKSSKTLPHILEHFIPVHRYIFSSIHP